MLILVTGFKSVLLLPVPFRSLQNINSAQFNSASKTFLVTGDRLSTYRFSKKCILRFKNSFKNQEVIIY